MVGAHVADLDSDGSPEIYIFTTSAGSGSYGGLIATPYRGIRQRQSGRLHARALAYTTRSAAVAEPG
jgi:hypothetical protein